VAGGSTRVSAPGITDGVLGAAVPVKPCDLLLPTGRPATPGRGL